MLRHFSPPFAGLLSALLTKGYGVRRRGASGTVDAQTEFGIMSTTKAVTALPMAMLVDEGTLSWKDSITKNLPEFQFQDPFLTREATVKDLLTDNIGIGDADLLWTRGDLRAPEQDFRGGFLAFHTGSAADDPGSCSSSMRWVR